MEYHRDFVAFGLGQKVPTRAGQPAFSQCNDAGAAGRLPVERHALALRQMNSVYVWFLRWTDQSVWEALLEPLVELGLTDDWQHIIDSTTVLGHPQAAGAKGDL